MNRGEVWVGNLNPNRGIEVGKVRPVLVVQADVLSRSLSDTVVVLPLTKQIRKGIRHLRITVPARDRLLRESQVMVDQPRTFDRARIGDGPLTRLTEEEMAAVDRTLKAVLDLR